MKLYIDAFNISFPMVEIQFKNEYIKREPWFTQGLIKSAKTKAKLFSKKMSKPSEHNLNSYREFNILHKQLQKQFIMIIFWKKIRII